MGTSLGSFTLFGESLRVSGLVLFVLQDKSLGGLTIARPKRIRVAREAKAFDAKATIVCKTICFPPETGFEEARSHSKACEMTNLPNMGPKALKSKRCIVQRFCGIGITCNALQRGNPLR